VAATRYPPQGVRGMAGMSRGSRFGTGPTTSRRPTAMSVIVQLETPQAMSQLEAIAAVGRRCAVRRPGRPVGRDGPVGQLTHPAGDGA
jgi:hypothetical protein